MVCLSAIWFGTLPGLFATAFTLIGIKLKLFESPLSAPRFDELRFFLFMPAGLLISFLGGRLRQSLHSAVESQGKAETSLRLLEEEKKTRDIIIAGLSHDLRNPIAAARISNEYVLKSTALTKSQRTSLERSIGSLTRADHLIQNILDTARVRAGYGIALHFSEFDVIDLMRSIVHEISILYSRNIEFMVEESSIIGRWDRQAIYRCVENLVTNAIKYGEKASPLSVKILKKDEGTIEISVHNFGSIISETDQKSLFDPYKRVSGTEDSGTAGWGLGLATTKLLIDAHHGSVYVASAKSLGTTFTLSLPLRP
jgi:signal transduction histidine kinase